MNKIQLRNIITQVSYAWFYYKPAQLALMYEKKAENAPQVDYDKDLNKMTITLKDGEDKLTLVLSKDAEGQRVVNFPQLGKREVFKRQSKRETVVGFALHESLLHFGLK